MSVLVCAGGGGPARWAVVTVGKVMLTNNDNAHLCPVAGNVDGRLVPVFSGPVVCCPVSMLVLTNVHRVLVVSAPCSLPNFGELLKSKDRFNIGFRCTRRPSPSNLTRTFVVNRRFVNGSSTYLILNSGVFCKTNLGRVLCRTMISTRRGGGTAIFNCQMDSPRHCNITRFSRRKGYLDVRRGPRHPGDGCTMINLCFCPGGIMRMTGGVGPSTHKRLRVAAIGRRFLGSGRLGIRAVTENFT